MFAVPFHEIAPILGRTPDAAKMLASRARRRVHAAEAIPADPTRQRAVVRAFLAASRSGDFNALLTLLDPDVVLRSDHTAVQTGALAEARGAAAVAGQFAGRAQGARPALINGAVGAVWSAGRKPRVVFDFTIADGKIVEIDIIADPGHIDRLDLELRTT